MFKLAQERCIVHKIKRLTKEIRANAQNMAFRRTPRKAPVQKSAQSVKPPAEDHGLASPHGSLNQSVETKANQQGILCHGPEDGVQAVKRVSPDTRPSSKIKHD
jgi:hypothetical protein